MKKIAIVHDYLKEYGGAERVVEELIKLYPHADLYTTIYMPEYLGPHAKRFDNYEIRTTWLQKLPIKGKIISYVRLIAPFVFKKLDLSSYDVVITSAAGTYTSPNFIKKGKKTKLICYCHTPPRYLYGYKTANDWDSNPGKKALKALGAVPMHFLRIADFEAAQRPDVFIANSEEVRTRIEKFYRRSAKVVYPPVHLPNVVKGKKEQYFLAGGRLARAKGMDVIIKAFKKNGLPLIIFGRGFAGYEEELKKMATKNVTFIGEVNDEKKYELMAGAKAFIFASYDEDFGITPVESMGVGTPVIAYRSGGVKETVIEEKTGIFFDENTPEALNLALARLRQTNLKENDCVVQAENFSEKMFDKKIKEIIENA